MEEIAKIIQLLHEYDSARKQSGQVLKTGGWNVTGAQVVVLRTISAHPGISISELSADIGIHITTAEGYAKRLAAKGLLEIITDPADKRRKQLFITATGGDIIGQVPLMFKSLLVSRLRTANVEESRIIVAGLEKLIEYITKGDPIHE